MKQKQILIVLIIFVLLFGEISYGQTNSKMSNTDKNVKQSNKLVGT
jgi:hypothetical protein